MAEGITIRKGTDSDGEQVIAVFNHYVEHGFAAYPETPVPEHFFHFLSDGSIAFYVIDTPGGCRRFRP